MSEHCPTCGSTKVEPSVKGGSQCGSCGTRFLTPLQQLNRISQDVKREPQPRQVDAEPVQEVTVPQKDGINADTLDGFHAEELKQFARFHSGGGISDVIDEIFKEKGIFYQMHFESLDTYYTAASGAGTVAIDSADNNWVPKLTTDINADDYAQLAFIPLTLCQVALPTWDKRRRLKAKVHFEGVPGSCTQYVTTGDVSASAEGFGFKVVNGIIYGVVHNGVTETLTDALHTLAWDNVNENLVLEVRYFPNQKIDFYIKDVWKATLSDSSTFPSGTLNAHIFYSVYLKTDLGAKYLYLGPAIFWQDYAPFV